MSRTRICAVGTALLCLIQAWSVAAHHSRAEFAEEFQEMEGEIVRVNWTNPHPTFEIDIAWNYFFFGFGLGDNVEVVERMTLSGDQSRLDYSAVFTDSETFTEPATIERYWVALGETPPPFDCTPAG